MKESRKIGKKITDALWSGVKRSFSSNSQRDELYAVSRMKDRGYDLYITFRDFFYAIWLLGAFLFYYTIGLIRTAKSIPHGMTRVSANNFRLGLELLRKNDLMEARIRFLLSNLFYSKSPATKYYIAYIYFLQHNYVKSLKYIRQSIQIEKPDKRTIELVKLIEEAMGDNFEKLDFKQ